MKFRCFVIFGILTFSHFGLVFSSFGKTIIIVEDAKACFRRVLAGKRIAPQWVRRTLSCERVEDCMKACGQEKRFMCEGFNYKIDPSGNGQGDCELVEVPLAQMDLYSSQRSRDSNLIRHPDYDYYERDRNAPSSCRKNPCKDCSSQRPSAYGDSHYPPTSVDRYGPSSTGFDSYQSSGPDYHYSDDFSSWSHSSYGDISDRYDSVRPSDNYRPDRWESIPSGYDSYHHQKHHGSDSSHFRPPYKPGSGYSPYRPSHYLDRDPPPMPKPAPQQSKKFVPYLIGTADEDWSSSGTSYGHSSSSSYGHTSSSWSSHGNRRKDQFEPGYPKFPYKEIPFSPNSIQGPRYDEGFRDRNDYRQQWTRRPGPDECSVKTSEGFRLHKTAIKHSVNVPTITECERLCSDQNGFICHTYSYRYSNMGRDNCMLCDRTINHLDYYVDLEPDRDYDIYSMSDDMNSCRPRPPPPYHGRGGSESTAVGYPRNQAQCFFRAIDATRFFKSIVRDSLTVRSIGQCELECIKSTKFTCRAFAFRYGQSHSKTIIDNCQLSDWPVRDMDKERHLVLDPSFDVFERASYGHGCELQPIMDDKHKKLCYLGYGSAAKLLSTAIKKVISVPSESECKKECIRYRENTPFKCFSFSYGSQSTSFNCEMSDLDQTQLKLNVHYIHTNDRDYWLFAWNPFDWTCRDKVNTIGGSRVNNDRRMDIFREPGDVTWRHYTVSGKACRKGSPCEKNLVTGFYSCEIESGEVGSWDYCCKTEHPCGFSKGFDYSWCYVGDEPDQWRKCSDRYFPGNSTHAAIKVKDVSKDKHRVEYQRPPRPGGLHSLNDFTAARLWPVTYLYSEGPPNSTEFSNFVDCNKESC